MTKIASLCARLAGLALFSAFLALPLALAPTPATAQIQIIPGFDRHSDRDSRARERRYHSDRESRARDRRHHSNRESRARDCHSNPQRHYHRELGRSAWHRHSGRSCRVIPMREERRRGPDCIQVGPVFVCP